MSSIKLKNISKYVCKNINLEIFDKFIRIFRELMMRRIMLNKLSGIVSDYFFIPTLTLACQF